jgi:hypothetical protein
MDSNNERLPLRDLPAQCSGKKVRRHESKREAADPLNSEITKITKTVEGSRTHYEKTTAGE